MRKKRDKKEQKADQKKYYDGLEAKTDEKARQWFNAPPAYNKPQRSESVAEYIRRKYGKGSDADGRSDDKRTSGVIPEQ